MATLSAEAKVRMLLSVLRTIDAAPNMQDVTDELDKDSELGIDTRKTARRRYKNVIEADGKYLLTAENKVIFKNSDNGNNAVADSTSKLAATTAAADGEQGSNSLSPDEELAATVTPKKRNRTKVVTDGADDAPKPAAK